VRATAAQQGKDVAFSLEGEDVELDKTMLEEMTEPLLHLLRNAVDHGIEPPALRGELGKPQQGQIRLRAFRAGTQIVIQVQDDGRGLDPQRLRAAAIQKGFVAATEAAHCPMNSSMRSFSRRASALLSRSARSQGVEWGWTLSTPRSIA
jgi:two-component system chemotaxis sensor kinase CheA